MSLEPGTRVRLVVETPEAGQSSASLFQMAQSLNLKGPPDWSERLEEYLYGDSPDSEKASAHDQ